MNFNNYSFFIFLFSVIVLYRFLPWKYGRITLVLASYFFYGTANFYYCFLLLSSTLIDYFVAIQLSETENQRHRKTLLFVSILMNIGLLSFFKYSDFTIRNVNNLITGFGLSEISSLELILPVGISFYTFQTLSYTIDVYRKKTEVCHDFLTFALYVAYFPQLVAGPIERASNLINQLKVKHKVEYDQFMHGIERILWGMAKKMIVADRLAVFVNEVYAQPNEMNSILLILACVGFMLQLYLDFSAYTDIAIGSARLMGVKLSENFNYPFAAVNVTEFWARWHITLTSWFRDYVHRPLGGIKRSSLPKTFINTLLVFTLIGLWHGAAWNFVFFGIYSGVCLGIHQALRLWGKDLFVFKWYNPPRWLGMILFGPIIYVGGIFFRSPDVETFTSFFVVISKLDLYIPSVYYTYTVLIFVILVAHWIRAEYLPLIRAGKIILNYNRLLSVMILLIALWLGAYDYKETFIYFQF